MGNPVPQSARQPTQAQLRNARQICSGVTGIFKSAACSDGSALAIAFTTAQGAAVVPDSPAPFTPNGFVLQTTS